MPAAGRLLLEFEPGLLVAKLLILSDEDVRLDLLVEFDAGRVKLDAEIDDLLLEATEQCLALGRFVSGPRGNVDWRVSDWRAPVTCPRFMYQPV